MKRLLSPNLGQEHAKNTVVRFGRIEDIATAALYLASDARASSTASSGVDGGSWLLVRVAPSAFIAGRGLRLVGSYFRDEGRYQ